MTIRTLRIFISSPGDVGQERVLAGRVIERLSVEFAAVCRLEPVLWEHEPMRATSHFQEQIVRPSETDFVVCILWSRLGTRLPGDQFRRPDGTTYESGTEFEFEDAAASVRARGIPDLLVFRRTSEPHVSLRNEAELERRREQLKLLDAFVARWFESPEGTLRAGFKTYERADEFEAKLEADLRKLIVERLEHDGVVGGDETARATWLSGSPFRGLLTFDPEHEAIFFGRTRAISEVKEALSARAARGTAFLVVLGMSGTGKSSLVRAGLIPTVTRPGVVEGVGLWRWCVTRPRGTGGTLFSSLVQGLCESESALPELAEGDFGPDELAALLRRSPTDVVPPIRAALRRRAEAVAAEEKLPRPPEARLLLAIDQMEELFTDAQITLGERGDYVRVLGALAASGLVWVVGTMRSDFYHRIADEPALAELIRGDGQYLLLPPSEAELAQIIRGPARAAGLRFEEERGQALDDVLQAAAARSPEALPLLEFTLEQLYESCGDRRLLTFAAYQEMGGLEGALSRHAERTFELLGCEAQAELPAVLRALVTVDEEGTQASARRVAQAQVATSPASTELVDAFVGARLLVADRSDAGLPILRLAHEALIAHWQRLKDWLAEDREFLRTRARVVVASGRWNEEGRATDFLLPEGRPLVEAEELLVRRRTELDLGVVEYIEASSDAWRRRREAEANAERQRLDEKAEADRAILAEKAIAALRVKRRTQIAAVGVSVLLVVALTAGWFAREQGQVASSERDRALHALAIAQMKAAGRWRALAKPVMMLPHLARAVRLDPSAVGARTSLLSELTHWPWPVTIIRPGMQVRDVAFSPDSRRIVTASADNSAQVWDAETGDRVGEPLRHEDQVLSTVFSPDGLLIATASLDKTVRLWNASGAPVGEPLRHDEGVGSVEFSPDSLRLLTRGDKIGSRAVYVWDVRTGARIGTPIRHGGGDSDTKSRIKSASFSPDGQLIATASFDGTVGVWDAASGTASGKALHHDSAVYSVTFSPDGRLILTASADGTARIWDANTRLPVGPSLVHEAEVKAAAFSPDGRLVVTRSENAAYVWNAITGDQLGARLDHSDFVYSAAFSPDSRFIVTASADATARVWDANGNGAIGRALPSESGLYSAEFSADGRRILTRSEGHVVGVWDAQTTAAVGTMLVHSESVNSAAFSPDGRLVITASADVRRWDARRGESAGEPFHPGRDDEGISVSQAAFSPDGQRLVITTLSAQLWDTHALTRVASLDHGVFRAAVFSPDGRLLLTANGDDTVRSWDARAGTAADLLLRHDDDVNHIAFSTDAQLIVTASDDTTARIWNASNGLPIGEPLRHSGKVIFAEFSADGRNVITVSDEKATRKVAIWDVATRTVTRNLPLDYAYSAAFTKDANLVVIGSLDAVLLWDPDSGETLGEPLEHDGAVRTVAINSAGNRIVTASIDRTARVWDLPMLAGTKHANLAELAGDLASLAETLGGFFVNDQGDVVPLQDRNARLRDWRTRAQSIPASNQADFAAIVRWLFAAPRERTTSPFSAMTQAEYNRRSNENIADSASPEGE